MPRRTDLHLGSPSPTTPAVVLPGAILVPMPVLLRVVLLCVLALIGATPPTAAQSTAYVSLTDPAYQELDALISEGLVKGPMLGRRPYSQATFARAVDEASASVEDVPAAPPARVGEALARLRARFGTGTTTARGLRVDAAWADSPRRAMEGRYLEVDVDVIDADVAPLLQGPEGRERADGGTFAVEGWGDVRLGSRLAAAARPRVAVLSESDGTDLDLHMVHAYMRGLFGNLSVEVGRNSLRQGRSPMGPTLSANARGLDMLRLSMEEPRRLPWILGYLGPAFFGGTLATLGDDRDNPGGVLVVWEGSIRPHPNLELGATLMNHQGGEGAPEASFGERVQEALFIARRKGSVGSQLPTDPEIGDKFLGVDAMLLVPDVGLELYVEYATTDDHDLFVARPRESLWNEAAWLGGARLRNLGREGRVDVWAEVARNGVRPYTHHQLTSGLTLDRRVLGSPLGPLATAFHGGVGWTGPRDRVSLTGAWERYHGDDYMALQEPLRWRVEQDEADEIRLRTIVEWMRTPLEGALSTRVRLGYEHVDRFDFGTEARSNFLAQVSAEWRW